MKKIVMVFAVGALLVSCNSTQDKEAAEAYCKCYTMNDTLNATSASEILEAGMKQSECMTKFRSEYNGKVSKNGFSEEMKQLCPEGHAKAESQGMFESMEAN